MNDTDLCFDYIEISGFMSFPPDRVQKIDLNTGRLTTIIGENLDGGDGERNGVGKTAIIDAILYCNFGRSARMPNSGFLNIVKPGSLLVASAARRGGIAFRVERGEAPSLLRLFEKPTIDKRDFRHKEGGKLIFETTKSTKIETTKRIVELLGFDLKLADVLLFNNPSDRSCYFLKTEDEQRTIVERIFGFTVFTEKAERLRDLRKDENKNLATKESALVATRQANDRVLHEINTLEEKSNGWAVERDKLARFLAQQIKSYEGTNFEFEIGTHKEIERLVREAAQVSATMRTLNRTLQATQQYRDFWETQHVENLTKHTEAIKQLEQADAEADINTLKQIQQSVPLIEKARLEIITIDREQSGCKRQIETEHTARVRLAKQIEAIEKQIIELNESKCPTCGQDWIDNNDHILHCVEELDKLTTDLAVTDKSIKKLRKDLSLNAAKVTKIQSELQTLEETVADLWPTTTYKTIENASRASAELAERVKKLDDEQNAVNPHIESFAQIEAQMMGCEIDGAAVQLKIDSLPDVKFSSLDEAQTARTNFENVQAQFAEIQRTENPYRETIDNLRTKALKPVDETEIKELRRKVEHMTLLITLLADRDSPIRKSILNEWLPELNNRVNSYLSYLELPHHIVFDPNMTASFTLNEKGLSFGNLSTGQSLRVWLATNRAFREIFELINFRINLFFVDEVLDKGMSSRGAEVSYRLLERMVEQDNSVFLITHRQELSDMSTNVMRVQLENGLTTIYDALDDEGSRG